MSGNKIIRFNWGVTDSQLKLIDQYRKDAAIPPSRAEAVRELIDLGLEAHRLEKEKGRD